MLASVTDASFSNGRGRRALLPREYVQSLPELRVILTGLPSPLAYQRSMERRSWTMAIVPPPPPVASSSHLIPPHLILRSTLLKR